MPLYDPLEFIPGNPPSDEPVFNTEEIPKEMNIFFRNEQSFLPPGKDFKDLTNAEKERLKSQYRFSPYRPGLPQQLSAMGKMIY